MADNGTQKWFFGALAFIGGLILFSRVDESFWIVGVVIVAWVLFMSKSYAESYAKNKQDYKNQLEIQFNKQKDELTSDYNSRKKTFEERERDLLMLLKSKEPYNASSLMYSDIETYIFKKNIVYLNTKIRPAPSSADVVKEMRSKAREYLSSKRAIEYKLKILLKEFPTLAPYIEDESGEALSSLAGVELDDINTTYDRARDFLSQEEYDKLSITERNQLALNRYNSGAKSNWVVGIEYEMYIEYEYRLRGWKTIPHGSINGLEDLGRDIVAKKDDRVLIIQCKRYSVNKHIHENTVCQLYGTAIEYELSDEDLFATKIVPILYSTTDLSPMAKKFAKRLGVHFYKVPMRDYPQIKCNVGRGGEKIYHLPFDQQYYSAIIDKQGEFYAWTVKEAEDAGFRRAKKYLFNKE